MKKYLLILFLLVVSFCYSQYETDTIMNSNYFQKNCNDSSDNKYEDIFNRDNYLSWLFKDDYVDLIEKKYFKNRKPTIVFNNEVIIDTSDLINSNVIIVNGSIKLYGTINGAVAALNSNIFIEKNAGISENIFLFNSSIKYDTSFNVNQIHCSNIKDIAESDKFIFIKSYKPSFSLKDEHFSGGGILRYNRVEGFYIGLQSERKYYWNGRRNYSLSGAVGYGFSNHRWAGEIEMYRWFGNENRIEFGLKAYSKIDSKDNWIIDNNENSVFSFFTHEDFKDYFWKEGWSAHLSKYFYKKTSIEISYIQNNYQSQVVNKDWALFGGNKKFRYNPPVKEGIIRSVVLGVYHNSIDTKSYMPQGWDIGFTYEKSSNAASFNKLLLDIRNYENIGDGHSIAGRFVFGSADRVLPEQKSFDLGGLGTIPAVRYKSVSGNRMALLNFEYSLPIFEFFGSSFDENEYHYRETSNLIFSYDIGYTFNSDSKNFFDDFNLKKDFTRQDFGIAIGFNRNKIRIGAAFRLDKSEPAQFILRFSKPF